jgi:hypothetical protein
MLQQLLNLENACFHESYQVAFIRINKKELRTQLSELRRILNPEIVVSGMTFVRTEPRVEEFKPPTKI